MNDPKPSGLSRTSPAIKGRLVDMGPAGVLDLVLAVVRLVLETSRRWHLMCCFPHLAGQAGSTIRADHAVVTGPFCCPFTVVGNTIFLFRGESPSRGSEKGLPGKGQPWSCRW